MAHIYTDTALEAGDTTDNSTPATAMGIIGKGSAVVTEVRELR